MAQAHSEFSERTEEGQFFGRDLSGSEPGHTLRPVLIKDTGLADWLPVGSGLLTFNTPAEAVQKIDCINHEYEHHRGAARRVAETHFASKTVLANFVEQAMD